MDAEEGCMDAPGEVLICDESLTLKEHAGDVGQLWPGQGEHSEGTLEGGRYLLCPELLPDVESVGNGGKDTEADFVIATWVAISVLNMTPPFWFMACSEVILVLSNLLIIFMSRQAPIACHGLLYLVFWLMTHPPVEAL